MLIEYYPKAKITRTGIGTGFTIVGGGIGKGSIWIGGITGVIIGSIGICIGFITIILWKENNLYPLLL